VLLLKEKVMKQVLKITLILLTFSLKCNFSFLLPFNNNVDVIDLVVQLLPKNPIILEAGSFQGREACIMAKKIPDAQIHSFEPQNCFFKTLEKRAKYFNNINCYNCALGELNGDFNFHLAYGINKNNLWPLGSLLLPNSFYSFYYEKYLEYKVEPIKVPVKNIASWAVDSKVKKIDFLWLDAQGAELSILKGMKSLINTVDVIYLNVLFVELYENAPIFVEVQDFLEKRNFFLLARDFLEEEIDEGKRLFGKTLFVRKKNE